MSVEEIFLQMFKSQESYFMTDRHKNKIWTKQIKAIWRFIVELSSKNKELTV